MGLFKKIKSGFWSLVLGLFFPSGVGAQEMILYGPQPMYGVPEYGVPWPQPTATPTPWPGIPEGGEVASFAFLKFLSLLLVFIVAPVVGMIWYWGRKK
jgi:hypothetical protein